MNASQPRLDFLLRRLILLAGNVRDTAATGDWEGACTAQEEYDETFATMQHMVERGTTFAVHHQNDLARLRHVHSENQALIAGLKEKAGVELGTVTNVARMRGYAPLGANHRPDARYLDGSA